MDDDKPRLSDVIGGMVASMVHARTTADMEALRIAYYYRENEFLKGLPIPRFRLQKVSFSLPVVLKEVIPGRQAKARHPSEVADEVFKTLDAALMDVDRKAGVDTSLRFISDDRKKIAERFQRFQHFIRDRVKPDDLAKRLDAAYRRIGLHGADEKTIPSDVTIRETSSHAVRHYFLDVIQESAFIYAEQRVAEDPSGGTFDPDRARQWVNDEVIKSDYVTHLLSMVCDQAASVSVVDQTVSPDFYVSVNTDAVKNTGGGPDVVTRLSLVLHEEGLEWVQEAGKDGSETTRLMTE
ncbi:MAG: hypothetical protein H7840_03305 [Alphaproteobacteria bacterium]